MWGRFARTYLIRKLAKIMADNWRTQKWLTSNKLLHQLLLLWGWVPGFFELLRLATASEFHMEKDSGMGLDNP